MRNDIKAGRLEPKRDFNENENEDENDFEGIGKVERLRAELAARLTGTRNYGGGGEPKRAFQRKRKRKRL